MGISRVIINGANPYTMLDKIAIARGFLDKYGVVVVIGSVIHRPQRETSWARHMRS